MTIQSDRKSAPELASAEPARTAAQAPRPTVHYVDRPDCNEIFADSISQLGFDGQTLRIEFAVSRVDQANQNSQVSTRVYPAARLVLTPGAAADLMRKLQQMTAAQARLRKKASSQSVQGA